MPKRLPRPTVRTKRVMVTLSEEELQRVLLQRGSSESTAECARRLMLSVAPRSRAFVALPPSEK